MTTNPPKLTAPPENSIVEWHEQPSSITTGIIGNVPPVRRIGRVMRIDADGIHATIFDPDGIRARVHIAALTVIAERAEAGWANLR